MSKKSLSRLAPTFSCLVRLVKHTWRVEIEGQLPNVSEGPRIYALWHGRSLPALGTLRHLPDIGPLVAMVSSTADGDLQHIVLSDLGVRTVRGCTLNRGPKALLELTEAIKNGHSAILAVDGPAGPIYCARSGAVGLSALSGAPIVPIGVLCAHSITIPSTWDQMLFPLPGARVHLRIGRSLQPPSNNGPQARAQKLDDLQHRLAALNDTRPTSLRAAIDKDL